MAEPPYHLHVRAFPDRGPARAVGVVLTRDGAEGARARSCAVQAPSTHRGTLQGLDQALAWLARRGRPAPVVVHTNLTSVRAVLLGTGEAADAPELVEDLRRRLAERPGSSVEWTGDREGNPHMVRAYWLAEGRARG